MSTHRDTDTSDTTEAEPTSPDTATGTPDTVAGRAETPEPNLDPDSAAAKVRDETINPDYQDPHADQTLPGDLEGASKADLYERATELEIAGRSAMSKEELAAAIAEAEAEGEPLSGV